MLLVYVDDLFIFGPNDESNELLKMLQKYFAMKQTGELTEDTEVQFLGRIIKRDRFRHLRIMLQHWLICWVSLITERHGSQDRVHHL